MKYKDKIEVNFDYLYAFCKEKNLQVVKLSEELGKGATFISDCKRAGLMDEPYVRLICALHGADYEKMTTIAKPETEPTNSTSSDAVIKYVLEQITEIQKDVALLKSQMATRNVAISDNEEIVLLLQQMTKYGQCEEGQFKAKAKSYGFSDDLVKFAIEHTKCKREVANGKVWLTRK